MTDPNIGRRWNSPYGVQIISERLQFGSGDLYSVLTEGTGVERRYRADSIDEVIKRNEHELTPEYAQERAEREELSRLKKERDDRAAAKQAVIESEIAAFTNGMTPMAAGKARAALLKQVSNRGAIYTRKTLMEMAVSEGARVILKNGKRILQTPDGSFWDESITKSAMDYAADLTRNL